MGCRLLIHLSIPKVVEFYAPWCGHCQNLKPAYEKAAKNLEGLAKVAAVNCDDDENKSLCGVMGVKGFPTLKTVRPGKKPGSKPIVEDYNGPRTAKGIADAVVDKINNHVKRLTDKDADAFLDADPDTPKAILFTEKGTTSALLRSIAIDFLDVISVTQVRDKEAATNERFGVTSYPTLVLIPAGGGEPVLYDGELKKDPMVKFLSQAGEPNPDPAPAGGKGDKKADKKDKKSSKSKSKSQDKTTSSEPSEPTDGADDTPVEDAPKAKPVVIEDAPAIPAIVESGKLTEKCLNKKSKTCVLALVPATHGEAAENAVGSLSQIAFHYARRQQHIFPFYEVHTDVAEAAALLASLGLTESGSESGSEVEVLAINAKKNWWRRYEGELKQDLIDAWIDAIRLDEGAKQRFPEGVIGEAVEVKVEEEVKIEVEPETDTETETKGADPTPEATVEHEEL